MLDYFEYKYKKKLKSINIKKELKFIHYKGFIESVGKTNDNGVGDTLQNELGIPRNNKKDPDFLYGFKPIELKSRRRFNKKRNMKNTSLITIFTTKMDDPISTSNIFNKYAYPSNGKLSLKCDIVMGEYKKQGFKLDINNDKLIIKEQKNGQICSFDYVVLLRAMKKKLNYLLLVKADNKIISQNEYFKYDEAWLYSHFRKDKFTNLLDDKKIIANFRMSSHKDHNFAFRIREEDLEILYTKKKKYYP